MKFCRQILFLLFALIFPILINGEINPLLVGLSCQGSRRCSYDKTAFLGTVTENDVICEDACVYYKCTGPGYKIIEGSGCLSNFLSTCVYIKTEIKNKIIKNIKKYEYFDQTVMVVTCSDKSNCAKDAFTMATALNFEAEKKFATALDRIVIDILKPSGECTVDRYQGYGEKVQCPTRGWCQTGKNYKFLYTGRDMAFQGYKSCDACVSYQCTADGGNKIMGGFGCYEDFERICQMVPSNVKASIKLNLKNSFHFDDNYMVVTCSSENACSIDEYLQYYQVNPFAKISANSFSGGTCEHGVATTAFSPSHQINIWTLLGIILAGFAFYIF